MEYIQDSSTPDLEEVEESLIGNSALSLISKKSAHSPQSNLPRITADSLCKLSFDFHENEMSSSTNKNDIKIHSSSVEVIECSSQITDDEEDESVYHQYQSIEALSDHNYVKPPYLRSENLGYSDKIPKKDYMEGLEECLKNFDKAQAESAPPEEYESNESSERVDLERVNLSISLEKDTDKIDRIEAMMSWNPDETKKFQTSHVLEEENESFTQTTDLAKILTDNTQLEKAVLELRSKLKQFLDDFDLKTDSFKVPQNSPTNPDSPPHSSNCKKESIKPSKRTKSVVEIIEKERRSRRKRIKPKKNKRNNLIQRHFDDDGSCLRLKSQYKRHPNAEEVRAMVDSFLIVSSKFNQSTDYLISSESEEISCVQVQSEIEDLENDRDTNIFTFEIEEEGDSKDAVHNEEADILDNADVEELEEAAHIQQKDGYYDISSREMHQGDAEDYADEIEDGYTRNDSGMILRNEPSFESWDELIDNLLSLKIDDPTGERNLTSPLDVSICQLNETPEFVHMNIKPDVERHDSINEYENNQFVSYIDIEHYHPRTKISSVNNNEASQDFSEGRVELCNGSVTNKLERSDGKTDKHTTNSYSSGTDRKSAEKNYLASSQHHGSRDQNLSSLLYNTKIPEYRSQQEKLSDELNQQPSYAACVDAELGTISRMKKSKGLLVHTHENKTGMMTTNLSAPVGHAESEKSLPLSEEMYSILQSTCYYTEDSKLMSDFAKFKPATVCDIDDNLEELGSYHDFVLHFLRRVVKTSEPRRTF